jgi:hypothetical protein
MTAAPSVRSESVALSNTTVGMLMATISSSIVLISVPAIVRGVLMLVAAAASWVRGSRSVHVEHEAAHAVPVKPGMLR